MAVLDNAKHEAFAQYLYEGINQEQAYEKAGYKPNKGSASRLANSAHICKRVAELQERKAKQADITVDRITDMLMSTHRAASDTGDITNQRQCAMDLAKLHGLIVDRSKVEADNVHWVAADEPIDREEYERNYTEGTVDTPSWAAGAPSEVPN